MKFIKVEKGERFATIKLVEGDPGDLDWNGEEYDFVPSAPITLLETRKRVQVHDVDSFVTSLVQSLGAIRLNDPEAVEAVLPPEPVDQAEVYEHGLDAPDAGAEIDEAELDMRLLELGFTGTHLDEMSLDDKLAALRPKAPESKPGPREPAEPETPPEAPAVIRGYRLMVGRHFWPPKANGKARMYEVGDTPSEDEVKEIEARWKGQGFITQILSLAAHPRAKEGRHTIWTAEPEEPICCLMPGCDWVGDHLGPHLKRHGFDNAEEYRAVTGYTGPAVVGRAAGALGNAHQTVRIRNDLKPGQIVVEIPATFTVIPWKIARVSKEDVTLRRLSDDHDEKVTFDVLFERYHPIGVWARRLLRERGIDHRPSRRIQRRRTVSEPKQP